jgi:magnesium-protoporphyrin O-methyltransferase
LSSCCSGGDYEEIFTSRAATGVANRFRRRGLRGSAITVVTLLTELGPKGMTVLEVGGGVGEIQVALLESGVAATATNVDLSPNWETAAEALLSERDLTDRLTRLNGDFVQEAANLLKADAVILHRVVCCYPDWKAMLTAAAARANRFVVVTFPRPRPWFRAIAAIENAFHRLRKRRFRAYIHPPEAMIGLLRGVGYPTVSDHTGLLWRTIVAERPAGTPA